MDSTILNTVFLVSEILCVYIGVSAHSIPIASEEEQQQTNANDADVTTITVVGLMSVLASVTAVVVVIIAVRNKRSVRGEESKCPCPVACLDCVSREQNYREENTDKVSHTDQENQSCTREQSTERNIHHESDNKTGYLRKTGEGKGRNKEPGPKMKHTRIPTGYWGGEDKQLPEDDNKSEQAVQGHT